MLWKITNKFKPFQKGDKVWLESKNLKLQYKSHKLALKWEGPFKIQEVLGPLTYQLELLKQWKIHPIFHATLLSPYKETDTTTTKAPLSPTTVQQLNDFYLDKASYLSFQTKVIHESSFTTFNYAYHSHQSLKHQIQMIKELLSSLQTMDETHITTVEAALLQMHKRPLGDKIFSKTTTVQENRFEKTTTTYLHNVFLPRKEETPTPKEKYPSWLLREPDHCHPMDLNKTQ